MNCLSKSDYRTKAMETRRKMSKSQIIKFSNQMAERLFSLKEYREAKRVFSYYSVNKEINTTVINKRILQDGKKLAFPVCVENYNLEFHQIDDLTDLKPGILGIPIPKSDEILLPQAEDIMIMPGLVFSEKGQRIGYGKGYYDNYLQDKTIFKIALVYDSLLLKNIITQPYDIRADYIITQSRNFFVEEIDV
ncbi:MAG: 5-formyltetrahydrofolate cyclo-ligase [Clostridia bacterium]|nr:5-formyltetrahydrofolate cyclo-ligase [Clostridia bacterium]